MALLPAAVLNNVQWCALVCGERDVADTDDGLWVVERRPPPLYPDAVTLAPAVAAARVGAALADRSACSVKDSYADVDLEPFGFRELVSARWLGRDPSPVGVTTDWSCVADEAGLRDWCAAAGLPGSLPARLLHSASVRVLGAYPDGVLAAGAIVNRSAAVVGVSNVFSVGSRPVWPGITAVIAQHFPGLPVVGYEHGADLDAARAAGFADLGPLRIWLRG